MKYILFFATILTLLPGLTADGNQSNESDAEALPGIQSYDYDEERSELILVFIDGQRARLRGVAVPIYEAFNIAPKKRLFLLALAERLPGHRMLVLEPPAPDRPGKQEKPAACTRPVSRPPIHR